MTNFQPLYLRLFCVCLVSASGSALVAQQTNFPRQQNRRVIRSQPVQGQVFQNQQVQNQPVQRQVFENQPVQGQGGIIYGQPVQGSFQPIQGQQFQGQPIQGQQFQGQPGTVIQGPIVSEEIIQGQPKPAGQMDMKAFEAMKVKIAAQDKYNNDLKTENSRLRKAFEEASLRVEQRIKSATKVSEEAAAARQRELDQLKTRYQKTFEGNESIADKVKLLSQENADLRKELSSAAESAGGDMQGLRANLNSATTKISELGQEYQNLEAKNGELVGEVRALTQQNDGLRKRLAGAGDPGEAMKAVQSDLEFATNKISQLGQQNQALSVDNNRLQGLIETVNQDNETLRTQFQVASEENTSLGGRVDALSLENRKYVSSVNSLKSDLRDASQIEQPQVTQSPAIDKDLESENSLLMGQVSALQEEVAQLNLESETAAIAVATPLPLNPQVVAGKFNILSWIIPFLLIGLGVGLYTYFMEEFRGTKDTVSNAFRNVDAPRTERDDRS